MLRSSIDLVISLQAKKEPVTISMGDVTILEAIKCQEEKTH